MPIEWAGLGPELLLTLDRDARRAAAGPARARAARGDPLRPAGRRRTAPVVPGDGRRARDLARAGARVLQPAPGGGVPHVADRFGHAGRGGCARARAVGAPPSPPASTPEPTGPAPSPRLAVDFCPGVPDLTSFPRADWARAMRDSCRDATPAELGYGDPRGTETLREVLAGYLRRVRGTVADAEQIVICVGFGQGINLVLRSLADDGDPAGGDRGPGRRRLPRDLRAPRDRGGSRSRSTSAGSTSTRSPRPTSAR